VRPRRLIELLFYYKAGAALFLISFDLSTITSIAMGRVDGNGVSGDLTTSPARLPEESGRAVLSAVVKRAAGRRRPLCGMMAASVTPGFFRPRSVRAASRRRSQWAGARRYNGPGSLAAAMVFRPLRMEVGLMNGMGTPLSR